MLSALGEHSGAWRGWYPHWGPRGTIARHGLEARNQSIEYNMYIQYIMSVWREEKDHAVQGL